jgi:hypothetical protein
VLLQPVDSHPPIAKTRTNLSRFSTLHSIGFMADLLNKLRRISMCGRGFSQGLGVPPALILVTTDHENTSFQLR